MCACLHACVCAGVCLCRCVCAGVCLLNTHYCVHICGVNVCGGGVGGGWGGSLSVCMCVCVWGGGDV